MSSVQGMEELQPTSGLLDWGNAVNWERRVLPEVRLQLASGQRNVLLVFPGCKWQQPAAYICASECQQLAAANVCYA
jgi:hypothetical protein